MAKKCYTKKPETCEFLIWNIPINLKTKFKAKCAQNGISMKDAIIDLMKKYSQ